MSRLPQEVQRKRLQRLRSRRQQFSLEKVNVAGKYFHPGINKYSPVRYSPRNKLQSMIIDHVLILSCLPKCAAQCLRTQLLSPWSGKYFSKIFLENIFPFYDCLSAVFPPYTQLSSLSLARGSGGEKKLHFSEMSPQAFQTVSVCCRVVGNWYLGEAPEMSLTAFYNLLLRNYLSLKSSPTHS